MSFTPERKSKNKNVLKAICFLDNIYWSLLHLQITLLYIAYEILVSPNLKDMKIIVFFTC